MQRASGRWLWVLAKLPLSASSRRQTCVARGVADHALQDQTAMHEGICTGNVSLTS